LATSSRTFAKKALTSPSTLAGQVTDPPRSFAFGDELLCVGDCRFEQVAGRDLVDQAEPLSFLGRDRVAGRHHLDRPWRPG
jgi:hypothetical protein